MVLSSQKLFDCFACRRVRYERSLLPAGCRPGRKDRPHLLIQIVGRNVVLRSRRWKREVGRTRDLLLLTLNDAGSVTKSVDFRLFVFHGLFPLVLDLTTLHAE